MNLEKLWGWDAATAYIHYHSQLGSKFNTNYVGSFVGVDNIEADTNTAQLSHAWLQKSFSSDSLSVLGGIYPIDSEFTLLIPLAYLSSPLTAWRTTWLSPGRTARRFSRSARWECA